MAQRSALRTSSRTGVVASALPRGPGYTIWDRPGYLVRRLHQIHVGLFLRHVAHGQVTPVQYGLLSILVNRPGIDQAWIARTWPTFSSGSSRATWFHA